MKAFRQLFGSSSREMSGLGTAPTRSLLLLLILAALLPTGPLVDITRTSFAQAEDEDFPIYLPRLEKADWVPATPSPTIEIALTLGATSTATAMATSARSATPAPSATRTPTAVPSRAATATPTLDPRPTADPTLTPTSSATPRPTDETLPDWLARLNALRASGAGLPPVEENPGWSEGARLHSRYMVKTDSASHREDPASPWYTEAGDEAGRNGNVFVSADERAGSHRALDWWRSAPFHAVSLLDPQLRTSAYGEHREAIGRWHFGATIDVGRGRSAAGPLPDFPLMYPAPESELRLLSFGGGEYPDPLPGCPGFTAPTGPPIYLMLGAGERVPELRNSFLFVSGGGQLPHCAFDETSFKHPDEAERDVGRAILNLRDAIVILPKAPLRPETEYRVTLDVGGEVTSWTFRTAPAALARFGPRNVAFDGR